jgi:hypothetical protein
MDGPEIAIELIRQAADKALERDSDPGSEQATKGEAAQHHAPVRHFRRNGEP